MAFRTPRSANVLSFGALGYGTTNDTVAIQAAINSINDGDEVVFPATGSGRSYLITAALTVAKTNVTFRGVGRGYATQIKCVTGGVTMIEVKAPGFVLDDITLYDDCAFDAHATHATRVGAWARVGLVESPVMT